MDQMFNEKDRDHDGKLSFEEFSGQETKLEKAFKVMDKDGDGYISKVGLLIHTAKSYTVAIIFPRFVHYLLFFRNLAKLNKISVENMLVTFGLCIGLAERIKG